jgi:hypothetical protein
MPPITEKIKVEHRGSLSFHVYSESKDEEFYVVDMELNGGNGVCTCKDFSARCQPQFRENNVIREYGNAQRTRCKHINAVLLWIGNEAVMRTIK